jgi:hypothetical protein
MNRPEASPEVIELFPFKRLAATQVVTKPGKDGIIITSQRLQRRLAMGARGDMVGQDFKQMARQLAGIESCKLLRPRARGHSRLALIESGLCHGLILPRQTAAMASLPTGGRSRESHNAQRSQLKRSVPNTAIAIRLENRTAIFAFFLSLCGGRQSSNVP